MDEEDDELQELENKLKDLNLPEKVSLKTKKDTAQSLIITIVLELVRM